MDIAKHKKEMEELLKFVKAKEEDPNADVSLPENYKLTSPSSRRSKEENFEYNRLRELAEYMNANYDNYAVSDDPGFIANFNANKQDLIDLSSELPWDLTEMKDYLNVLHSIPKGLSAQDKHGFTSALECSECVEESGELWRTEPFNDVLLDLKSASIVEFNSANGISACTFSFTDKVLISEGENDFKYIILNYGKMNKFDIDNLLLMIDAYSTIGWDGEELDDHNQWQIPAGFEDTFIESIIETGYSFKYYDHGPDRFIDSLREVGMNKIADFLETRSHERLVKH